MKLLVKKLISLAAALALATAVLPQYFCVFADGDPVLTVLEVTVDSGVIELGGTSYYKVPELISGQDYILAVTGAGDSAAVLAAKDDDITSALWSYSLNNGGGSNSSATSSFTNLEYDLKCTTPAALSLSAAVQSGGPGGAPPSGGQGGEPPSGGPGGGLSSGGGTPPSPPGGGGGSWSYDSASGIVSYTSGTDKYYLTYTEGSGEGSGFGCTDDPGIAANVVLFTSGPQLGYCISSQPQAAPYVLAGSGYEAPIYTVSSKAGLTDLEAEWYVDGQLQAETSLTLTADALADLDVGVYPVYCTVSGRDSNGNYYHQISVTVNFIVAEGVLPNSFLIFSDVHEKFENIGTAILEVMTDNSGKIPSLVVCTGDWVNGATADTARLEKDYLPKIRGQLGGLDTVYVAGNHEASEGAANASVLAGLGAQATDLANGAGVIFDSSVSANSGTNSRDAEGLIVYGINYYAAAGTSGTYSYDGLLAEVGDWLEALAAEYDGELVVIAAHAGLHVLGSQPESLDTGGSSITAWSGGNSYNLNSSAAMAALLNDYAENYNMDILFLFGHDHSKGEAEFFLTRGDELISAISYADGTSESTELSFLYGHSGYLTDSIGSGREHYSLYTWDDTTVSRDFRQIGGASQKTSIDRLAETAADPPVVVPPVVPRVRDRSERVEEPKPDENEQAEVEITENPFRDVEEGKFYTKAVLWAVSKGIAYGTDEEIFSPGAVCTRAQMITFLWRAFGSPAPEEGESPFSDVPEDSWCRDAVLWAVQNGITMGTDDDLFSPGQTVDRAQCVTFLWRAAAAGQQGDTSQSFTDVPEDSWFAKAVKWAVSEGISYGTGGGRFSPGAPCTRGEIVTFLYRYFVQEQED